MFASRVSGVAYCSLKKASRQPLSLLKIFQIFLLFQNLRVTGYGLENPNLGVEAFRMLHC